MDLTPRDIQDKQFNDSFRGYNHEEVDLFLDEVADAFDRVFKENQSLLHKLREIETQLEQARGTEDMLKRTLITAQRTAEEAVEEARSKAQGMIVAAERKSQEIVATAEQKAQEIVAQAHAKERELQVIIEGLKHFESEFRARMHAFIESQLRVLEEGPIVSGPAMPAGTAPASQAVAPASGQTPVTASPAAPAREMPETKETPVKVAPEEPAALSGGELEDATRGAVGSATAAIRDLVSRVSGGTAPAPRQEVPPATHPAQPQGTAAPGGREEPGPSEAGEAEEDEERSIEKLFWGEE